MALDVSEQTADHATTSVIDSSATTTEQTKPKRTAPGTEAAQRRERRARERPSMPFVASSLTLNSFHAQQTFDRGFPQASEGLHMVSVVVRVVAGEGKAVEVDLVVNKSIDDVAAEMKAELERLTLLADENGIQTSQLKYSEPKTYTPQVTSPRASGYLQLIREFDKLVGIMDALWLSKLISDSELSKGTFAWKRKLLRLANDLRTLAIRAMAAAQRKDVDNVVDPRAGTPLDPNHGQSDSLSNRPESDNVGAIEPSAGIPMPKEPRAAKPSAAKTAPVDAVAAEAVPA